MDEVECDGKRKEEGEWIEGETRCGPGGKCLTEGRGKTFTKGTTEGTGKATCGGAFRDSLS